MGAGNFDVKAYQVQAKEAQASKNSGFTAKAMCDEFNPAKVNKRFSKRGPFNEFRDVITVLIGLDVTGSMDKIPKSLLEGKLGSLMVDLKKTFNRPNENLQISFAGIGDAKSDQAPLQVTHFESDNRFAKQLQKIWLEGGGGGNGAESYNLLWWYASNKTQLNYVKQDQRKGILITIGDDNVHLGLAASEIQAWLDPSYDGDSKNISNQVLLDAVRQQYEVYHIVIKDGQSYGYDNSKRTKKTEEQITAEAKQWKDLLGQNNVIYSESKDVADAIATIIKKHRPLQKANMANLTEEQWEKHNKENLTDEQWKEVLSYTLCPLTGKFMEHPVELSGSKELGDSKKVYEEEAIETYVKENKKDPITHKKLTSAELDLKPNSSIAQLCLNYKPFFYALPEDKRKRLVQSTLDKIKIKDEHKKPDQNPLAFFSKGESEQAKKDLNEENKDLECPITGEIMEDPVMLVATGQSYEKKAIEKWLEDHDTDPLSGVKLEDKTLAPNIALRKLCQQALSKQLTP